MTLVWSANPCLRQTGYDMKRLHRLWGRQAEFSSWVCCQELFMLFTLKQEHYLWSNGPRKTEKNETMSKQWLRENQLSTERKLERLCWHGTWKSGRLGIQQQGRGPGLTWSLCLQSYCYWRLSKWLPTQSLCCSPCLILQTALNINLICT